VKKEQRKAAARPAHPRPNPPAPGRAYADTLSADEVTRFAEHASPVDELLLLRAQVHRLARRIDLDDLDSTFKRIRLVTDIVRVIATLERLRLQADASEAAQAVALARAVAGLDPGRDL
jgi:hypothetical protein